MDNPAAQPSSNANNTNAIPRRRYIPDWMKLNFDRFNHATNLEEYGSSPPDTGSEFIRALDMKLGQAAGQSNTVPSVLLHGPSKNDPTSGVEKHRHKRLHRRPHDLQRPLSSPQFENVLDSCLAYSSCSSAEVTPAVTPQGSPCLSRRILNQENLFQPPSDAPVSVTSKSLHPINEVSETSSSLMLNQQKLQAKKVSKACKQRVVDSALGHKKYLVTNFDINAVGPTSW